MSPGPTAAFAAAIVAAIPIASLRAQVPAFDPGDLATAERRAADRALPVREREAAADRAIEIRRALINAAADAEPRLTGWLIDQAGALLARLARDGADAATLFGVPLPAQRTAAASAAAEAAQLLARAEQRTQAAIAALDAAGAPPADPRREGPDHDRTVRIPFFRARAEAILAALTDGPDRAKRAEAGRAGIARLALANTAPEAARRINLAALLLWRRSPPDPADAQIALDECSWIVRAAGENSDTIPAALHAEAWMAMVHAGIALGRVDEALAALHAAVREAPFTTGGRADTMLCVLVADAAARALFQRAAATNDPSLLARAVAEQEALLARTDLGLRPESLRPLVYEKLAILAAPLPPSLAQPPAVRLSVAIAQARDPRQRDTALRAFADVAEAPDAGLYAADALWELAVLVTQPPPGEPAARLRAARALTRLAADFPAHTRAAEAINAALVYARALAIESTDAALRRDGRAAYADALRTATTVHTTLPNIDLWRYERARLIADPLPGEPEPSPDQLRTAVGLLELIPAGSPAASDALRLHERLYPAAHRDHHERLAAFLASGDDAAARDLAREHLLPAAQRALDWARAHDAPALPKYQLALAEALADAAQPGARPLAEALLPHARDLPGGEPRVRLVLARALLLAGDAAAAFPHLRQAANALDVPVPGGPVRAEIFWHAWTLMLESLADQNHDGARSTTIRAQIKRLRSIDPDLGGEPWRTRIARVEAATAG